jgi:hypothetical protein
MYSLISIPQNMLENPVTLYAAVKDGAVVAVSSVYSTISALVTAANS